MSETLEAIRDDKHLLDVVSTELPALNYARAGGSISMRQWVSSVTPIAAYVADGLSAASEHTRLDYLQALGFVLTAAEYHAQSIGFRPGQIISEIPTLERSLLECAGGSRAPVLTAELYWERNHTGAPLTLTGSSHERFFISAVRTQVALRRAINDQLRSVARDGWDLATVQATRILRSAAAAMRESHGQYLDFRRGPDGSPMMTPAQFNEMRTWLVPTMIDGRRWSGPNAAYIDSMIATDFLIGTADDNYRAYATEAFPYLSPAGRKLLREDMERTTLAGLLLGALGVAEEAAATLEPCEIAMRIERAPAPLATSLRAFKDLVDEFVKSSGAHLGLIHVYLEKYGEDLPTEVRGQLLVSPTDGVGGHSHEHTRRLHDMRRKGRLVRCLLDAFKRMP